MDHHGDPNVVVSLQRAIAALRVGISEDLLGNLVPESGCSRGLVAILSRDVGYMILTHTLDSQTQERNW
jgi:hypothetical protein